MNENIDLTKILEGCPEGTEFHFSVCGIARFKNIDLNDTYPIVVEDYHEHVTSHLTKEGKLVDHSDAECLLFPSKDQRDWSKFERFWDKPKIERFDPKTLQPFDKVLVRTELKGVWNIDIFGYKKGPFAVCLNTAINDCIPFNNETEHLLGTNDDCPEYYKWWEE